MNKKIKQLSLLSLIFAQQKHEIFDLHAFGLLAQLHGAYCLIERGFVTKNKTIRENRRGRKSICF